MVVGRLERFRIDVILGPRHPQGRVASGAVFVRVFLKKILQQRNNFFEQR
jgi:hypothetical protein